MGVKIRTMWMTPFYLFFGVLFIYFFQKNKFKKKLKNFIYYFYFLFFLSPSLYLFISLTQNEKRTDFQEKK